MVEKAHQEGDILGGSLRHDPRRRHETQQRFRAVGAEARLLGVDLLEGGDEGARGGAADGRVVGGEPFAGVEAQLELGCGAQAGDDGGGEGGVVARGGGEEKGDFDVGEGNGVSLVDLEECFDGGKGDARFDEEGGEFGGGAREGGGSVAGIEGVD